MRKWTGLLLVILIIGAFMLHLFAMLEIFPLFLSSIILFIVLFLTIIWATSKNRFRGFSSSKTFPKRGR
ncbi:hypothetical protein P6709_14685 [Jeotgalibacillus sp. ET6]|uniref:hypothetical protein n=1 Tax=Jeotgalibacillus sp. ET6 TaxID=3037260 RepID=UPI00241860B0|nr:hypothetical protein [Jeotgalibacillus sp. ET6]MDG5472998.1 hypothetical protein [Jeotgalibacillus sp. ET6]